MTAEYKPDELLYLTRLAEQSERYEGSSLSQQKW